MGGWMDGWMDGFPMDGTPFMQHRHAPRQVVARAQGQDGDARRGVAPVHRLDDLEDARGRAVAAAHLREGGRGAERSLDRQITRTRLG